MIETAPTLAPAEAASGRDLAVVLNGAAGALLGDRAAMEQLTARFAAAGLDAAFVPLDAGTLPERVEIARRMDRSAVVVGGGDGTIACAARVLAGTGTPLGILPFGTMNLLAKDLGIPTRDPGQALAIVAAGEVREIDVGEVNGHVFLCASMLGLSADLGRFREARRARASGLRLWSSLGIAFLRLLRRHLPRRFRMEMAGRTEAVRAPAITIAVNEVDEPEGRSFGRSRLDGGELVVYIIARLTLADVAGLAVGWLRGSWRRAPVVSERRGAEVTFRGRRRPVRVMNDGELTLLRPPLRYLVRRRALRVFAPVEGRPA